MVTQPRIFIARDGRRVVIRSIRWEDLDDAIEFINSLADEGAEIYRTQRVTRSEEADWLGRRLARMEKGELIEAVAEVDEKVVANSEVEKRTGVMSHLGYVGLAIRSGYRGIGIGTELMKALIEESRMAGLKVLVLDHYETNKAARGLYEKAGFKEAGSIPKAIHRDGTYTALVRMVLEL
jgi:ribosomal protein S18 acetylase RimI-like enzyme